jgi:hypothetical protein
VFYVEGYTRTRENSEPKIIDLIFTNEDDMVDRIVHESHYSIEKQIKFHATVFDLFLEIFNSFHVIVSTNCLKIPQTIVRRRKSRVIRIRKSKIPKG